MASNRAGQRALVRNLIVLVALAWLAMPAQAELVALVHETGTDSLRVVGIDSSDGSVTPGTATAADCCFVLAGMTAADTAGRRFFAYGFEISAVGSGTPILLELGFDGNSASAVAPARSPEGVLAYDSSMNRLVGFDLSGSALQLVAIDPSTGAVSDIGAENTACCEVLTGTAAIDSVAQRLYFVGRDFGTPSWSILSISLNDGTVTEIGAMPAAGRPGFLSLNDAGTELEIYMQAGIAGAAGLYRVAVATGTAAAVSVESDSTCCLMGLGETASLDGEGVAWWMAGSGTGAAPSSGFMALRATGDTSSVPAQPLPAGYALHALVVDGQVANPFVLFSDRFEL